MFDPIGTAAAAITIAHTIIPLTIFIGHCLWHQKLIIAACQDKLW